jgi:bacillolysin
MADVSRRIGLTMKTSLSLSALTCASAILAGGGALRGQQAAPRQVIAAETSLAPDASDIAALAELRVLDRSVDAMRRAGELETRSLVPDALVPGRTHERLVQIHGGVRVFGGDLARQTNQFGQTVSLFGVVYPNIDLSVAPGVSAARASTLLGVAGEGAVTPTSEFELVVLPTNDGGYRLTWTARVASSRDGWIRRFFLDAATGEIVRSDMDTWTQAPVTGSGTGVIGDRLKVNGEALSGTYYALDLLQPGTNTTYDMRGDPVRTSQVLSGLALLAQSDVASDPDNVWNAPAVVSAHAYRALTYEYYRERFGRNGLNDHDIRIRCLVNPVRPQDVTALSAIYPAYFNNAAYYGAGYVVFGAGSATSSGVTITRNFAGALDVVAHELTHGVTQYTSNLIYSGESGALNEAFSDIMGALVEFRWQPIGVGPGKADWLEGEDVTLSGQGIRSFIAPNTLGSPDHYSLKFTGSADNGGVHINSNIVNHMFYLAVVGGTNRVSGLSVESVGFAQRGLLEQVIYRAFTQLLPSNATFSMARAATIQAARDLYGQDSPAERALTQAWTAVGVE